MRYHRNPILRARDWPYSCNAVFNPAAVRLRDGTTLLMCRVEDHRGLSHLCCARSVDGFTNWVIDSQPTMLHEPVDYPGEKWGIEDSRITYLPELDKYAILYTSFANSGPSVSLAMTDDFRTFERFGMVMPPEDKDAALLPRRIGENWALIHRPVGSVGGAGANIWISYSPDLKHWGNHKVLLEARRGAWWDADRIGLSPPLIETPNGWLMIYHGVRSTVAGKVYRCGLALLDLETPERCIRRGDPWLFGPEKWYERKGDVENVVFPCGVTVADDEDTVHIYYGAADTCVAVATASLSELLSWLDEYGRPDWNTYLM
jgi:predicted GH43/DUF377 family glycosyl hydrolase